MVSFASLKDKSPKEKATATPHATESPSQDKSASPVGALWYSQACHFVHHALKQVSNGESLSLSEAELLIAEIVKAVRQDGLSSEAACYAMHGKATDSFLVTNMVNVAVYATMLGGTLRMPEERLMELGLAALLHDIGKILVPEEVLFKKGSLTTREWEPLRSYPYDSFKILSTLGDDYSYLAETAISVYERLDGSGYPNGLKGEEIHPYAQIIGLADVYEAITHDRPHRKKFSHFEAIKEILRSHKKAFRRDILKALLETLSLYPLHSYVKLNSGAIGMVVQTYQEQPLRPKIQLIVDAQKRRLLVPRTLDLRDQALLHIAETVSETELPA